MWVGRIFAYVGAGLVCFALAAPVSAAEIDEYPDPDTEKACESPTESPECAVKTFWACSEKTVETCKLMGLEVQPEGKQRKADDTPEAVAWVQPWTLPWTELLAVTNPDDTLWEIKGLRAVVPSRLRGALRSPRSLAGTFEMMILTAKADGTEEKFSVYLVQRKGAWNAVAYARWQGVKSVDDCEKRKYGSLSCRYMVIGLAPW
jgi:hypothetical protein